MRKILALPLFAIVAGCATSGPDLPTQANVDLDKYVGTWHE